MARRRGNNEGSIFPTSNGTWRAQVTVQGKRYSCTADTRRECQEWIKQTLKLADNGISFAGTQKRMAEHLKDWLTNQEPSMRPKTAMHYRQLLKDYVLPFIGQITLGNLRAWHIQELYTRLNSQGVGIHTIRKVHKFLHSALESAVETGILSRNPASSAHPPKEPVSEMKTLDENQVSQFLVTISTHKWEPLFYLACTSGMRRGELLGLQWSDLDWSKQTITIQRQLVSSDKNGVKFQSPKTKLSRRTIALGDRTIQTLRAHYEHQQLERLHAGSMWVDYDLLFCNSKGGPIGASNLGRVFHRLLEIAGLPQLRFHDLRHCSLPDA